MSETERPPVPPPPRRSVLRFGTLPLASRFLLSPLAGYTNLPFRLVVRELGGLGLATTDLVNARALLIRSRKTLQLRKFLNRRQCFLECSAIVFDHARAALKLIHGQASERITRSTGR